MKTLSKILPAILALALLVAGPALAGQPTPRPRTDSINLNSSRSNIYRTRATPTPTPAPVEGKPQKQQLENQRTTTTNGSRSNSFREEAPGSPTPTPRLVEATTVKGSRSNGSERLGTGEHEAEPTPGPVEGKPQKQQLENQRGALTFGRDAVREVAPGTPTPATQRKRIAYSEDARRTRPSPTPAGRPR